MAIQPLQRVETGAHYELLLRLKDETGRIVSPNDFIAAAERYGITPAIDRWVIENSFRWLVSEADEREKLLMCSINLSGQSLGDDKFLPFVIDQFHRSGLDAKKICFEITETAAVASFSQANRFIQALKELGCKFALDDFGTGLSSFGYLKHFPVDFLKIDGSFVREILRDPIDREMVRSINEIGHLTGKQTIARVRRERRDHPDAHQPRRWITRRGMACRSPSRSACREVRRRLDKSKKSNRSSSARGACSPAHRNPGICTGFGKLSRLRRLTGGRFQLRSMNLRIET
jgi:EAL domain-containing protein (putative c-di-GMP-specific phosphodiesterase class I)